MSNDFSDTICAPSTATGESAISGIRISGALCSSIVKDCFSKDAIARYAYYGEYCDIKSSKLDDVLYIYFKSPNSYTGEDSLEIFTHGNPFIVQKIMEDLIARGCRLADHGEFTKRAFLNKKMDLSQAEAVSLMIASRSDSSLKASKRQLSGELGRRINSFTDSLVDVCALIEAYIDFPEENLPQEDSLRIRNTLKELSCKLAAMIENSKYTSVIHNGINLAIIGEPNAGKSSILNLLLGTDRAIVSSIAGTTRDFISDRINIGDYLFNITDTAGIRNSNDEIEEMGISKAFKIAKNADIILLIQDSSTSPSFSQLTEFVSKENTIVVLNKSDLPSNKDAMEVFKDCNRVYISCKDSDKAYNSLKDEILSFMNTRHIVPQSDDILVSSSNAESMKAAQYSIDNAITLIEQNEASELVSSEIKNALENLGEIVGKVDNEEILGKIFSKFCIGK